MPSLDQIERKNLSVKILVVGDSGSGKTGGSASLAIAGYNLRILDFDRGTDILLDPKILPPEFRSRIEVETCTDVYRTTAGRTFPTTAQAWMKASTLLDKWPVHGNVCTWTRKDVLIVDSTTFAGKAAMNFHLNLNARLAVPPQWQDFRFAQEYVERMLELLYSEAVGCHVVLMAHIDYKAPPGTTKEERDKQEIFRGYPTSIGSTLGPKMGRFFNHMLLCRDGYFWTQSRDQIALKSSMPSVVKPTYPLKTGLADYFADVLGERPEASASSTKEPLAPSPQLAFP